MNSITMVKEAASNTIDWNGGQRTFIEVGQTATCQSLTSQLYAIFLYNENDADKDIQINVTGSNQTVPMSVTVPGTTAGEGLASIVLVDGSQTSSISVNVDTTAPAGIDAWIGILSMPTDTAGLSNKELPADGVPQPFSKYCRYYAVPASHWYNLTLKSNINQFFSVQFTQNIVTVFCVNPTMNSTQSSPYVHFFTGFDKSANYAYVAAPQGSPQTIQYNLQGSGLQTVWMNADSRQDSSEAIITLATLQAR
ncbi:MAG: hypothetical protein ACR2O0_14500 [Rhizobiaceae bacterium]